MYGHLDKQPEMTGWREGFGPWTPVLEDGRLYGRGGADDGYAVFCALAALKALKDAGRPHARVAMLIECCEESGSYDLPAYLELLATAHRNLLRSCSAWIRAAGTTTSCGARPRCAASSMAC